MELKVTADRLSRGMKVKLLTSFTEYTVQRRRPGEEMVTLEGPKGGLKTLNPNDQVRIQHWQTAELDQPHDTPPPTLFQSMLANHDHQAISGTAPTTNSTAPDQGGMGTEPPAVATGVAAAGNTLVHRVLVKVGDDYYPARLSPMYDKVGNWRDTPEFERLVASAKRDGKFQQAALGKLVKDDNGFDVFEIEDGRHRFFAAEEAELHHIAGTLTTMPVSELIVRSLCERLHMTKGARAYLIWPLVAPQVEANKEARKSNLKRGKQKGGVSESGLNQLSESSTLLDIVDGEISEAAEKSLVKLAAEFGIERTLLDQARRVHEIFARRKDLKEENEAAILAGDLGMGAYLAGIAGAEATRGKGRKDADPLTLLHRGFKDLKVRFERWSTIPDELRRKAANDAVDHVLTAWPEDVREKLKKALA